MTSRKKRHGRGESPDRSYRMPASLCLVCGYFMDAASNMTGKGRPREGDISMCLNCGALHRFDVRLGLVPTTLHAVRDLVKPEQLRAIIASQHFINSRGPIVKKEKPT